MRYFSYYEPTNEDNPQGCIMTISEDIIRRDYYPYWYEKMCNKFGQKHVDEKYCFLDCIDDWMTIHWAWEVKD